MRDSIKHVIKAHETIVFDRMKELLATEEQAGQQRRAAQRRGAIADDAGARNDAIRKHLGLLNRCLRREPQPVDVKPMTTDKDENLCVICMEAVRGYAPTSCGHRHFCHGCSTMLEPGTPCPSCRVPIASWVRIHN